MKSKKVLVTGAAGFIGSHLSERLLEMGHSVFGIDNFDPYYSREIKEQNLVSSLKHENFRFYELDLVNENVVRSLIEKERPDTVIHLAAKAGVRPSLEKPLDYVRANVEVMTSLLQIATDLKIERFVYASSSSIYGDASTVPFSIDEKNLRPISPYGATKLACEQMAYVYSQNYKLPTIGLRFFTVYGPRQRPDLAIHKFADKISNGQPIDVFGDGSTSRDYTYISDIIDGITGCLDITFENQATPYHIFNLGSHSPISLNEMIAGIEKVTQKSAVKIQKPEQTGDVKRTYADVSASVILGYKPKMTFENGLKLFWNWYKENKREGIK